RLLLRHGCGPGRLAAVRLPPSPGLVVALLAVLTARAAYLPVDPQHPPERAAPLLADAAPSLLLDTGDGPPRPGPPVRPPDAPGPCRVRARRPGAAPAAGHRRRRVAPRPGGPRARRPGHPPRPGRPPRPRPGPRGGGPGPHAGRRRLRHPPLGLHRPPQGRGR